MRALPLCKPEGRMKTALYARVSTTNGQDPEMQLRELREYAARRGWEIADEYTDHGVSGSRESRPELNRLMPTLAGGSLTRRHLVIALAELGRRVYYVY
jgi:DNA invertase Pin-like site-specific DNA recombinase